MDDETVRTAPQRPGYDALWLWFGLSRASWLTLPRVLMHEMPDDWQARMAALLEEWDERWRRGDGPGLEFHVRARRPGGRFVTMPWCLVDYRRPNLEVLSALMGQDLRKE